MSDQFVDDLFARLHAERSETLTRAASATQSRERVVAAACVWWDDFCQISSARLRRGTRRTRPTPMSPALGTRPAR